MYVVSFNSNKDDEGVWGYMHPSCTNLQVEIKKSKDQSAWNMPTWVRVHTMRKEYTR